MNTGITGVFLSLVDHANYLGYLLGKYLYFFTIGNMCRFRLQKHN